MPTVPDAGLAAALRLSVTRLSRRMRAQRAGTDLTLTQLSALATVERHPGLGHSELADREKVSAPSMTRTVSRLEERGLLERLPHATDRRQVLLRCTPAGVALLKEDRRRREAWLAQRLHDLTPAERDVLRQASVLLDRLAGA